MTSLQAKKHQGFGRSKIWGHISKIWKAIIKGMYQFPPIPGWNFYTQIFGGRMGWNYSRKGLPMHKASTSIAKKSGAWMTSGIAHNKTSSPRKERKRNLGS